MYAESPIEGGKKRRRTATRKTKSSKSTTRKTTRKSTRKSSKKSKKWNSVSDIWESSNKTYILFFLSKFLLHEIRNQ